MQVHPSTHRAGAKSGLVGLSINDSITYYTGDICELPVKRRLYVGRLTDVGQALVDNKSPMTNKLINTELTMIRLYM